MRKWKNGAEARWSTLFKGRCRITLTFQLREMGAEVAEALSLELDFLVSKRR